MFGINIPGKDCTRKIMPLFDLTQCRGIETLASCGPTVKFAAAELQRYLTAVSGLQEWKGRKFALVLDCGTEVFDAYMIGIAENGDIKLYGNNPRSLLYAVYELLNWSFGIGFFHCGIDTLPERKITAFTVTPGCQTPSFRYRGVMLEHVDEMEIARSVIDFTVKNRGNVIYTHFSDLEQCGSALIEECHLRGLEFTVGGHSVSRFAGPGCDMLYNETRQICYHDHAMTEHLYENITAYLERYPGIDRLALWPSDTRHDCPCEACAKLPFNERYIHFMEKLQQYLDTRKIPVRVEYEIYNAGLSHEMMALPREISNNPSLLDTQFAYWGRDYRYSWGDEMLNTGDRQGLSAMLDWACLCRRNPATRFTLVEYYTDFWMLSDCFPFLASLIVRDVRTLHHFGIDSMISLVVPGRQFGLSEFDYPWLWIMGNNAWVFLQSLWNCAVDIDLLNADYLQRYYGDQPCARMILKLLRETLPEGTSFNVELFRLRFTDIGLQDNVREEFAPDAWTPETPVTTATRRRDAFCTRTAGIFEELEARLKFLPPPTGNARRLDAYFQYLRKRFLSLALQLQEQQILRSLSRKPRS